MKKNIINWVKVCGLAVTAILVLATTVCGIAGIYADTQTKPFYTVEVVEDNESLVREVLAWYYEEGSVEDEHGQLWWFDSAQEEGQLWRLWIDDNGTPHEVTDDMIVDYTGG